MAFLRCELSRDRSNQLQGRNQSAAWRKLPVLNNINQRVVWGTADRMSGCVLQQYPSNDFELQRLRRKQPKRTDCPYRKVKIGALADCR
jgi:hypothetical protein